MTKAVKISLSPSSDIPFDKLILSERNVRRVQTGMSIEELAEDIAQRTLLQSLSVRPSADKEGYYEVQAGGRRYRALALLVKQKRLAKNAPIPCIVRENGILEEDSLAENVQRQSLHPLDQFRAFHALREQGLTEEEIAARFFVTTQIVKQRLKLASVSPKLLEIYAADEMTLEQLMAFTVLDDHARQEQIWETASNGNTHNRSTYSIKRLLAEDVVATDDKRVLFVRLKAYEDAGGIVARDLFSDDGGGWLQNVSLLHKLVDEKLALAANGLKSEGWKWVTAAVDFPYGHKNGLRRIFGKAEPMTADEQARYEAMEEEVESIEREYFAEGDTEIPAEIEQHLSKLQDEIYEFEDRPISYDPAEMAISGVFLHLDQDGFISMDRGYVRPEDEVEATMMANDGENQPEDFNGGNDRTACTTETTARPISATLMAELTAHRTLGLRNALAADPDTAFLAVLHALALQAFYRFQVETCLEITAKNSSLSFDGLGLNDCAAARAIDDRHRYWEEQLPKDAEELWTVLLGFDLQQRQSLFAHCASLTTNGVFNSTTSEKRGRGRHTDQLAHALALDLVAAGWRPTSENYLGRVSKERILAALTEAVGPSAAATIAHLRKAEMARSAERLLSGTGWLPEPLRNPGPEPTALDTAEGLNEASTPSRLGDDAFVEAA